MLLRSDGSAVVRGDNSFGQCNIPASKEGNSYVQVSAGPDYTMLLTSDGEVLRVGQTDRCAYWTVQVFVPNCEDACSRSITSCKQVSAGGHHMLVLHRSGKAQALSNFGYDDHGQCQIPALEEGVLYTQVSAGGLHTLLLRSDGRVVACGSNGCGQCQIPPLDEGSGLSYTEVSAGDYHSVLLRSDGMVVTCGDNSFGQCDISPPEPRKSYVCDPTFSSGDIIVHVQEVIEEKSAIILRCSRGLAGESLDVKLQRRHLVMNFRAAIANAFKVNVHRLRVVLPKGELQPSVEEVLVQLCRKSPQSIMRVSCQ